MSSRRSLRTVPFAALAAGILILPALLLGLPSGPAPVAAQAPLVVDGDFEMNESGKQLRAKEKPQGWYESRRDGKEGRLLLQLSKKPVYGNRTKKAMIKADPKFNTYMSQRLGGDQKGRFSVQYDIAVREIAPELNRAAFQILGNAFDEGRGPNASGRERFVFLGFENGGAPGKMNLFAYEGKTDAWDTKTRIAEGLDLKKWYTILVDVDVPNASYTVNVAGVSAKPVQVQAFRPKGKSAPKVITHISFASWNDGPGTFWVDNVRRP